MHFVLGIRIRQYLLSVLLSFIATIIFPSIEKKQVEVVAHFPSIKQRKKEDDNRQRQTQKSCNLSKNEAKYMRKLQLHLL